jgi:hypothetical protein
LIDTIVFITPLQGHFLGLNIIIAGLFVICLIFLDSCTLSDFYCGNNKIYFIESACIIGGSGDEPEVVLFDDLEIDEVICMGCGMLIVFMMNQS